MVDSNKALEHLGYEWWMFKFCKNTLNNLSTDHDPIRNLLIEGLALHGRALIDFFCTDPKKDDMSVEHIDIGNKVQTITIELSNWRTAVNKRIAHLTYTREFDISFWKADDVHATLSQFVEALRKKGLIPTGWAGDATAISVNLHLHSRSMPSGASAFGPTGPSDPTGLTGQQSVATQ